MYLKSRVNNQILSKPHDSPWKIRNVGDTAASRGGPTGIKMETMIYGLYNASYPGFLQDKIGEEKNDEDKFRPHKALHPAKGTHNQVLTY